LDCRPRDSLKHRGKTRKRKKDEGGNLDGRKTIKEHSTISRQGNSWKQWRCEETPLRLQHTISRKAAT
jgi:hypothetical protein